MLSSYKRHSVYHYYACSENSLVYSLPLETSESPLSLMAGFFVPRRNGLVTGSYRPEAVINALVIQAI